ncbi:nuclease, putative [Ricinus communis]|uniref:Nuclease, putative n=1 Tax=Ricinus communis TaxID=3988 RepID=B9RUE6_RICCO|nr:nuclease, putative [Ricinus communis]
MEEEKDVFYVVRKGDVVGIYKSLRDCQAQVGSSVCNPSVSVFKGYGLAKDAEDYLVSHGIKDAAFSIHATDVQPDLFGKLVPCPFQQPAFSEGKALNKDSSPKSSRGVLGSMSSCILEFDGASKGNPGPAGAGAVLRAEDGSMVCLLREGLGTATNNVAEYRAVILGLKHALRKGFKHIRVRGDSNLVVMQIKGLWKIKSQNVADLCKEAKELKNKFLSFQIEHVLREFNSEADTQANLAVNLKDGQIEEDCSRT